MISPKQRNCKICKCSMVSNETTCQECKRKKKAEAKKDKPLLTQEEVNALKVAKTIKPKKEPQNQKELDKIKLEKKKEKDKIKRKIKSENKKYTKESLLRDVQKLVRLTQPLFCFICKEPYQGNRVAHGSHLLSRQYTATCYYAGNLSSGCNICNCNVRTAGEQYFHSLELDKLYGAGHSETIFRMGKIGYKWSKPELVELRELIDKYLNLTYKTDNISKRQQLWLDFKAEQEKMDFFIYLQKELNK